MRNGNGFILVYSVTDRKTFEEIQTFHEQILRVKDSESYPMVLIGNKCDLESERVISYDEGKNYAKTLGISFLETSARKRKNVDECFYELVRNVRKEKDRVMNIKNNKNEYKKKKCTIL
jgi:GTPase KRas protein